MGFNKDSMSLKIYSFLLMALVVACLFILSLLLVGCGGSSSSSVVVKSSEPEINSEYVLQQLDKESEITVSKLPKYKVPSKTQPIDDALEFITFTNSVLKDTMKQNEDYMAEIGEFDQKVKRVIDNK